MAWDDCNNTDAGDLTIGGVAMNCAAWRVENLFVLWLPAAQRGDGPIRPGVPGRKPNRRWPDQTTHTLFLRVTGEANRLGVAAANNFIGMAANMTYLEANVVRPTGVGDGTRASVLTMPDGSTRNANVYVERMEPESMKKDSSEALFSLEVTIPTGRYV